MSAFTGWAILSISLCGLGIASLLGGLFELNLSAFLSGMIALALSVTIFAIVVPADARKWHDRAYHDLRAQGWNIKSSDVKWKDGKVRVDCATFGLHKLSGKYRVTTDRSASQGGGYIILKPLVQDKLEKVCP